MSAVDIQQTHAYSLFPLYAVRVPKLSERKSGDKGAKDTVAFEKAPQNFYTWNFFKSCLKTKAEEKKGEI